MPDSVSTGLPALEVLLTLGTAETALPLEHSQLKKDTADAKASAALESCYHSLQSYLLFLKERELQFSINDRCGLLEGSMEGNTLWSREQSVNCDFV